MDAIVALISMMRKRLRAIQIKRNIPSWIAMYARVLLL